jgi:hypothetical protein
MTLRFTFLGYEYASVTAHFGVADCFRDIFDVLGLDIERSAPVEPVKAAERVVKGISKLWINRMLGG